MTKILRSLGVTAPIYNQGSGSHPLVMFAPAGNDPANVAGDFAFGPAIVDPTQIPDTYPAKADLVAFVERWKADNPNQPFASLFLGFAYDTIHLAEQAIETAATQDAGRLGRRHEEGRLVGRSGSLRVLRRPTTSVATVASCSGSTPLTVASSSCAT